MIRLVGTSHISPKAIKRIREEIREGADCVAVELDEGRYEALRRGEKGTYPSIFFKLLSWLQDRLANKTGVIPGEEMLTAVERARDRGIGVYLIDRPIYETMRELQDISVFKKIKLILFSFGKIRKYDFSLDEVPSEEIIRDTIELLEKRAPELYEVLVNRRDEIMATTLQALSQRHDEVIAVVGAGHLPGIKRRFDRRKVEYVDKTFK